jgi:hypothetical protein
MNSENIIIFPIIVQAIALRLAIVTSAAAAAASWQERKIRLTPHSRVLT